MNYECYITIELTFLKELILRKQPDQESAIFVIIGIFKTKGLRFNHMYAIALMMY